MRYIQNSVDLLERLRILEIEKLIIQYSETDMVGVRW